MEKTMTDLTNAFKNEFNKVADNNMEVEVIKGDAFGYGSELDCFKVLKAYNYNGNVDYSENLNTHYVHING